jgi:hypothetical protein
VASKLVFAAVAAWPTLAVCLASRSAVSDAMDVIVVMYRSASAEHHHHMVNDLLREAAEDRIN